MYANIFIVVIVVLFASQTSSSSISFPFFCAPSQYKKIYSPFFDSIPFSLSSVLLEA